MLGVYLQLLSSPMFWVLTIFVIITCLIPDYLIAASKEIIRKDKRQRTIICEESGVRNYDEVVQTTVL